MADTSQISPFIYGCSGGLVLNKDTFSFQPGESRILQNFEPDIKGGYKKILGTSFYNTNIVPQVSVASERVVMSAIFNDKVLVARGGTIYQGDAGSGSWTSVQASLGTPTANYTFSKFNFTGTDNIVVATGTSFPKIIDTSYNVINVNASGSQDTFSIVEVFKNHIFFAGATGSTQEIKFMGPFQTNDFTTGNGGGAIKVDTTIIGMKVFRGSLFIFGLDKIFKLTGTSLSDFSITPVTRTIGCLDRGSIQELGGDIVFLAPDGIRTIAGTERIDDVELGTVSKQIQERIDEVGVDNISSLVIRKKSQYRMFYPKTSGAEVASRAVISVVKTNSNTGQLGYEYADMLGVKPSCCDSDFVGSTETAVHGGYDGYIYLQESGNVFTRVGGTANIESIYKSPDLAMGDPGIRKSMQRVIVNYTNEGLVDADLTLRYDYDSATTPQPSTYPLNTGNVPAIYGTGTYNNSTYNQSSLPLVRQDVQGSGFAVAIKVIDSSAFPPISLKGFELEFTPGGRR